MNRLMGVSWVAMSIAGCGDPLVGGHCLPGYLEQPGAGCVRIAVDDGGSDAAPTDPGADATPTDPGADAAPTDPQADAGTCASSAICNGVCVDLANDPTNCGNCGHACSSGICVAGSCRDALAGHVVLIGHDYEQSREDQDRVVGNAVFLATHAPVRVLAYVGEADTSPNGAVAHVDAAITTVGGPRTWESTRFARAEEIATQLTVDRFDVVLVYEQSHATDEEIAMAASAMGGALERFARAGGVVVVLDGARHNGGTYPIVNATRLLDVRSVSNADDGIVDLVVPTDALAIGVRSAYRARNTTVRFDADAADAVFVNESVGGALPVVLHRAVYP
jgi:hypothetical protein